MSTDPAATGGDTRRLVLTRELVGTVVLFLVLLASMIAYNVRTTDDQAAKAMQINVATRQEDLVDNYVQDVVLASQGFAADPGPSRDEMETSAAALLNGGDAPTPLRRRQHRRARRE